MNIPLFYLSREREREGGRERDRKIEREGVRFHVVDSDQ